MFEQYFQVIPLKTSDTKLVSDFIASAPYYFRHLDWHLPTEWLGTDPVYCCTYQSKPVAIIMCPFLGEEDVWLRCFSANAFHSMKFAWQRMIETVRQDLLKKGAQTIYSISLVDWYQQLLNAESFQKVNEIVVLEANLQNDLDSFSVKAPPLPLDLVLETMNSTDISGVVDLDQECFESLWRMSYADLMTAFRVSQNCTVLRNSENHIIGYQISNHLQGGGHLARIAIHPSLQGTGLSKFLLADLMQRFRATGVERISVNTQSYNEKAISLYQKFGFVRTGEAYPVYSLNL